MKKNYLFTSESVSEGHPDKVCDIISDSVVDDFLSQENPENSRVAMETLVTTNKVVMAGEVRGPENYSCNYEELARNAVREIGYEQEGFHWKNFSISKVVSYKISSFSIYHLFIPFQLIFRQTYPEV